MAVSLAPAVKIRTSISLPGGGEIKRKEKNEIVLHLLT